MLPTFHYLSRRALVVAVTLVALGLHAVGAATVSAAPVVEAKLTASDAVANALFGISVSMDGDTAVVGAYLDDDAVAGSSSSSGSAYVYTRSGNTWTQQAKLTASDAAVGDQFGISVAVSGDTAVIGAWKDDDAVAGTDIGSAYVFTRSGTTWTQQAKLTASDAAELDHFGNSVSLDGDTAVIGADSDDDDGFFSGSAYVFTRSGITWTQQAKLTASDAAELDKFGISVSVDGDTAVVGAYQDDDAVAGTNSGSAYVFTRSGTTWTQQAKLTASDAAASDRFGISVSVDGDTAVVGAHKDGDVVTGTNSGSTYVFIRSGSTWTQQAKLTASDAAAEDQFGTSVVVSGDTVVIGADVSDDAVAGTNSGSAYVFTRSGTTWAERAKLTASDAAAGARFGNSVSVSGDTAVIGSFTDGDAVTGVNSGSAYVYRLDDIDSDGDGQTDGHELTCGSDPLDAGSLAADYDGDTVPDCVDDDDDNDGVLDRVDAYPMSNLSPTVVIGSCDSGVPNQVLAEGAKFSDVIAQCSTKGAANIGQFASCVAQVTLEWQADGLISGRQGGAIKRCAFRVDFP